MWSSSFFEMACACSVLSFAMMVRLLIMYLLFCVKSLKESAKSSTTAPGVAPENEALGDKDVMISKGCDDDFTLQVQSYVLMRRYVKAKAVVC
jgi:hypothetical protein